MSFGKGADYFFTPHFPGLPRHFSASRVTEGGGLGGGGRCGNVHPASYSGNRVYTLMNPPSAAVVAAATYVQPATQVLGFALR